MGETLVVVVIWRTMMSGVGAGSGWTERVSFRRHFMMRRTARTRAAPPTAPRTAATITLPLSCGPELLEEDAEDAGAAAKDITTEGGLGHRFDGMFWAAHALAVADANKESTKDGFCEKAASMCARTACSAFDDDEVRLVRDTSTETSMLIWETD